VVRELLEGGERVGCGAGGRDREKRWEVTGVDGIVEKWLNHWAFSYVTLAINSTKRRNY
jgi:hypothetical protein